MNPEFVFILLCRKVFMGFCFFAYFCGQEKTSNTKRFNELNYKVLSELKRENRFTI